MRKPKMTGSAGLSLNLSAFGGLFLVFTTASFTPLAAFVLALITVVVLVKL